MFKEFSSAETEYALTLQSFLLCVAFANVLGVNIQNSGK